jgi:hypothetical protein
MLLANFRECQHSALGGKQCEGVMAIRGFAFHRCVADPTILDEWSANLT